MTPSWPNFIKLLIILFLNCHLIHRHHGHRPIRLSDRFHNAAGYFDHLAEDQTDPSETAQPDHDVHSKTLNDERTPDSTDDDTVLGAS